MEKTTILDTTSTTRRTLKVMWVGDNAYLEIRDPRVGLLNINVSLDELRTALEES